MYYLLSIMCCLLFIIYYLLFIIYLLFIYLSIIIIIIPGCEGEGTPPLLELPGPSDATGPHPGKLLPAFN